MHEDEWTVDTETTTETLEFTAELDSRSIGMRLFWIGVCAVVAGNAIYVVLGDLLNLVWSEFERLIRSLS
jgi:hypothetical protein